MLGPIPLIVAAAILFLGSTILSTLGFGIGIVSMPVLLLVLSPQTSVVTMNTVALGLEGWIVLQARHDIPFKEIGPVAGAGLLGVPIGVFILTSADPGGLRIGISVLVIVLTLITTLNFRREVPFAHVVGPMAGFVVGVVLPSFGVGGPLIALFLLTRNWSRQAVRASMAFYLLAIDIVSVLGYGVAGLYTQERLLLILIVIVPVCWGLVWAVCCCAT